MQWENETNFSLRLDIDPTNGQYSLEDRERARWVSKNKDIEVNIYSLEKEDKFLENGGLEFETVFNKKPSSNEVKFTLKTKGLNFYYQIIYKKI